jgi:hypothetical protein
MQSGNAWKNIGVQVRALKFGVARKNISVRVRAKIWRCVVPSGIA